MSLFKSIWDDFQYSLRAGNMVTRLVVINFAAFVALKVIYLGLSIFTMGEAAGAYDKVLDYLWLHADLKMLAMRFWGIFTHMFLHDSFWHLFNNMVGLYLFGTIVSDLVGERRILPIYLIGGLVGAAVFVITAQFFPIGIYALGASAAVMALGGAALILAPDYRVALLLLGAVKVKYIVLVLVLLDLVGIAGAYGSGGHAAHIAGFAAGCFFVFQLRDGRDMAVPMNNFFARIRGLFASNKPKPRYNRPKNAPPMRATFGGKGHAKSDTPDMSFQEKLDAILDKIKAQGYESLSQEEKDFLYEASQK